MDFFYASEKDSLNELFNAKTDGPLTVVLPKGAVFREKVFIERGGLVVQGNGSSIVWNDHNGMKPGFGTSASATLTVRGDDVTLMDLRIVNDFDYVAEGMKQGGDIAVRRGLQAVAVFTSPTSTRTSMVNCTLESWQDTLFCDGVENSFENCTISGNIDFIFGRSHAVFHGCKVISLGEGFVSAPSTLEVSGNGLVFEACDLVCTDEVPSASVRLARPWHPEAKAGVWPMVEFRNCRLGRHIDRKLWASMHDSNGGMHHPDESRFMVDEKTLNSLEEKWL